MDGGGLRVFLLAYSAHQNKQTSHQQHKGHQPSVNGRFGRSVVGSLPVGTVRFTRKRVKRSRGLGYGEGSGLRVKKRKVSHEPISEPAAAWANGSEEGKPKGEGSHESQPDLGTSERGEKGVTGVNIHRRSSRSFSWAYSTVPSETDGSIVVEGVAYLFASDCYQDDVEDEGYSREERSWQDDCEADDRGEARSTVTFGPIDSEVAPPSEKSEKGNDQTEKGEATGDGVENKGGGQAL